MKDYLLLLIANAALIAALISRYRWKHMAQRWEEQYWVAVTLYNQTAKAFAEKQAETP